MIPEVVNFKLIGYKLDTGDIYIGRANKFYNLSESPWKNPFKIGALLKKNGQTKAITRQVAIDEYRIYIQESQPTRFGFLYFLWKLAHSKRLVCWCKPEACHGDVLVELMVNNHFFANNNLRLWEDILHEFQQEVTGRLDRIKQEREKACPT